MTAASGAEGRQEKAPLCSGEAFRSHQGWVRIMDLPLKLATWPRMSIPKPQFPQPESGRRQK